MNEGVNGPDGVQGPLGPTGPEGVKMDLDLNVVWGLLMSEYVFRKPWYKRLFRRK